MSLLGYTRKIKSPRVKEIALPAITAGESSERAPLVMPPEMAESLLNCKYSRDVLQIGRGGLEKVNTTAALGSAISHIISASVAGTVSKYVSAGTGVYKLSGTSFGSSLVTTAGESFLVSFNDNLIICDGERTKRWNGTHCFVIGSHKDNISSATQDGGSNIYSGTAKTVAWTTDNDGYYRRVIRVSAYMKKSGSPTGTIKATVSGTDSEELTVSTDIATTYATVHFDFTTPVDLPPNTSGDITFTMSAGDSSNYVVLGNDGGVDMIMINGPHAPKAAFGFVRNAKLHLGGDSDNKEKIYFSNVNLPDDFFSTSQTAYTGFSTYGGYFSFNDDTGGEVVALNELYNELIACGKSGGQSMTVVYDDDYAVRLRFKGGAISAKGLVGSPKEIFYLYDKGASIGTGTDAFGDLDFGTVSSEITSRFVQQDNTDAFCTWFSTDRQMWVKLPGNDQIQVFHVEKHQWTRYQFAIQNSSVTAMADISGEMYIGFDNGFLYRLDEFATDDDDNEISYEIKTKRYNFSAFSRTRLKGVFWDIVPGIGMYGILRLATNLSTIDYPYKTTTQTQKIHTSTYKIYKARLPIIAVANINNLRFNHNLKNVQFVLRDLTMLSVPTYVGTMSVFLTGAGRED